MDFLSLNYRDPLYGLLLLIVIVFIIHIANYWAKYLKKKDDEADIQKFIKHYETSSNILEYKEMILKKDLPLESVILMAMMFDKSGEFEKSIQIYSTLLQNIKDISQRKIILTLLAKTYYKAGFLYKSRDIFLTALKISPKNKEALTYLVSIYETLQEYNKAIEVLQILKNLSKNPEFDEKILYFKILDILNKKDLSDEQKIKKLTELGIDKRVVQRKLFEFATLKKIKLHEDILKNFDFENVIDILWDYEGDMFSKEFIKNNPILSQIYTLKDKGDFANDSSNFEIKTLLKLKQLKEDKFADLSFTYTCKNCKNIFPLYFYRCPVCKNINSAIINTILTRKEHETGLFV